MLACNSAALLYGATSVCGVHGVYVPWQIAMWFGLNLQEFAIVPALLVAGVSSAAGLSPGCKVSSAGLPSVS